MLACKTLEAAYYYGRSVAQFIIKCLKALWKDEFNSKVSNVLLLCSDIVAYILLARKMMKEAIS